MSSDSFDFERWFEEEFLETEEYTVQDGWGSNQVGGFERERSPTRKKTYRMQRGSEQDLTIRYEADVVGYSPAHIRAEGSFDTGYLDYEEFDEAVDRLRKQNDAATGTHTSIFEFTYVLGDGWEEFVDELTDAVSGLEPSTDIRLAGSEDEKLAFCYAAPTATS